MSRILSALAAAPAARCALLDSRGAMSYGALCNAVGALVHALRDAQGARAAILADNGRSWVAADLALLTLGIVNVPIPAYFSPGQIEHVLADAGIDLVLTDQPDRVRAWDPAFTLRALDEHGLALLRRRAPPARVALPLHTAKVTYTSGSTGQPRGVCLSQQSIEAVATSLQASTCTLDIERHLSLLPLPTLLENVAGVYVPILSGATCCVPQLADTGASHGAVDMQKLLRCIDTYGPDSLVLVPELLRVLLNTAKQGWRPAVPLKFIAVGGARVSAHEVKKAHALGLPVYEGYGLSECASVVCLNTPEGSRPGSVGRALPHAQLRIDANGELHVRGAVMNGYLGDTTAAVTDEVATGDLAAIDAEGYVHIHGRAKNLIITSLGRNIAPEWVESELLRDPVIAQALVIGEAQPFLAALIVSAGSNEQIERAIALANAQLPDYARVRRWTRISQPFSARNGLLTANGRPRREVIQTRYATAITTLFAATAEAEECR